jgi:hypothetical protein
MKIQTLNKSQKKKLLELCEEFFPNYKQIFLTGDNGEFISFLSHKELYGFRARTVIHWYQLCLTELPKRIWDIVEKFPSNHIYNGLASYNDKGSKANLPLLYNDFTRQVLNNHPVDFLYDFVQECKKNKYFKK